MTIRTDPSIAAIQHNAREASLGGLAAAPTTVAAAGATQGTATQIASPLVATTVTTSSQGVKLPNANLSGTVRVAATSGKGVKVYPLAGQKIRGNATNAAVTIAAAKVNLFVPVSATEWVMDKGA